MPGVDEAGASKVEVELTDTGGSGSRILDGEEGTEIEVTAGDWLDRGGELAERAGVSGVRLRAEVERNKESLGAGERGICQSQTL